MTDRELLDQYARHGSRDALNELAARHLDWVYSAALRQVGGDAHLAEDVTQAVFLVLARKARSIDRTAVIGGWLFRACRYAAADARRQAARRTRIESRAAMMRPEPTTTGIDDHDQALQWARLTPVLDESLARLRQSDRDAVILRYYQGKSHGEVGVALGVSEEAAKKRVARAVDKLGAMLRAKGVGDLAPAALPVLLTTQVTTAAPTGLLATASPGASAIAQAVVAGMTWTKLKLVGAIAAMFVVALPVGLLVTHAMARDRAPAPRGEGSAAVAGGSPAAVGATTEVVRWHAVLDTRRAGDFLELGSPEPTASVGFTARRFGAGSLMEILRRGVSSGAVAVAPQEVHWLEPGDSVDTLNTSAKLADGVQLISLNGQFKLEQAPGAVKLSGKYEAPFFHVNQDTQSLIQLDTKLTAGEAVVFIGPEADAQGVRVRPVLVLQAVACTPDAAPFLRALTSGSDFVTSGPEGMLKQAQLAVTLKQVARRAPASGNWAIAFTGGVTARLLAVGEPAKRPHVWWDGDGRPVAADPYWHTASIGNGVKEYAAVVEFLVLPGTKGGITSRRAFVPVDLSSGTPRVVCGVGVDAWKTLGKLDDQPLQAEGFTFTLDKKRDVFPNSRNPQTSIAVKHTAGPDVEVMLDAIGNSGKRVKPQNGEWSAHVRMPNEILDFAYGTFPIAAKDVRAFVVMTRPREWKTIEGFALEPAGKPTTRPQP